MTSINPYTVQSMRLKTILHSWTLCSTTDLHTYCTNIFAFLTCNLVITSAKTWSSNNKKKHILHQWGQIQSRHGKTMTRKNIILPQTWKEQRDFKMENKSIQMAGDLPTPRHITFLAAKTCCSCVGAATIEHKHSPCFLRAEQNNTEKGSLKLQLLKSTFPRQEKDKSLDVFIFNNLITESANMRTSC